MNGRNRTIVQTFSAQAGSPPDIQDIPNEFGRFLTVLPVITVIGSHTLTLHIEGFDPASGLWYSLLSSAAHATVGQKTPLQVGPALPATANVSANSPLPQKLRVRPAHSGADPITYSLGIILSV